MWKNLWQDKKVVGLLIANVVLMLVYAWWSYGMVTPNLVLSQNQIFWQWQLKMWTLIYNDHWLRTVIFAVIITLAFVVFYGLTKHLSRLWWQKKIGVKQVLCCLALTALPLFGSYNALSADVFNYIFNAKIVTKYHADPHVAVAQDFAAEPMLKFMHNSHTPAPYGYGFTVVSLPFYLVGANKFILQWLAMRAMSTIFLVGSGYIIYQWWQRLSTKKIAPWWLYFNPLILIEFISNAHNDFSMLFFALWSFYLISDKSKNLVKIMLSAGLLIVSTQIKFATVLLVPFWLYLVSADFIFTKLKLSAVWLKLKLWLEKYFYDLMALAMFIPLLTERSQLFHPWYLSWSLVWLPFCRSRVTKILLLSLSMAAMLRYLPYLWIGEYTDEVLLTSKIITLVGGMLLAIMWWSYRRLKKSH